MSVPPVARIDTRRDCIQRQRAQAQFSKGMKTDTAIAVRIFGNRASNGIGKRRAVPLDDGFQAAASRQRCASRTASAESPTSILAVDFAQPTD